MKQVVRCVGCSKVVGLYKTYSVMMTETPIVNGVRMPEQKFKARVCKECAQAAGYKIGIKHEQKES